VDDALEKTRLRQLMRAARAKVTSEERRLLAEQIVERALDLPEVANATHVLGYAALPEEFDPKPLLDALRLQGAVICLPRVQDKTSLTLHVCEAAVSLESGPFGLRQPEADALRMDPDSLDLIIVPGTAFDARGARIGMGGGYYDRLLAATPLAHRIALAFDFQITEKVPELAHDQRVDVVITPSAILRGPLRR